MPETLKCSSCGTELLPSGHCPKCLIGLGVAVGEIASCSDDTAVRHGLRHFAGYELKRLVGTGGMGVVYEAVETDLNRAVALKFITDTQAYSPVARRRFFIEAEAAARLEHPNIVSIYHIGEHEDQPFISMKLVKGESLRAKMDRGEVRLSQGRDGTTKAAMITGQRAIAGLVADIARAVHYAHTQNVVHRDLKPANILIDAEGNPQLTDFSLAKILDDQHLALTEPGTVQGTVPYMSPEQVHAERVSAAADTYSLGVILYELLTGQLPFHGTTAHETMRLIEEQPPTRPRSLNKHIGKDLETICLKCMEKKPGNRYSSTADLAEDLDHWLRKESIKARPAGPALRAYRWTKRNPLGVALILSLSLALCALIGLFWQVKMRSDVEYAQILSRWTEAADLLWSDPNRTNLLISAEDLANLERRSPPNALGATRLIFAVGIGENPVARAQAIAPLLRELQRRMSRLVRSNVLFDLKIVKSYTRFNEVAAGTADFQHMGPVPFWRAKELSPGVQAVVQDRFTCQNVIVVRQNSSISNLNQFDGHSFAFPDINATVGHGAKVKLVNDGIRGTNLSVYVYIGDDVPIEDTNGTTTPQPSPGDASGVQAAIGVLTGQYDGAALQTKYFDRIKYKKPGLRAVARFDSPPRVFAARAGLDTNIVAAFQQAVLELNSNPELLGEIPIGRAREGFEKPNLEQLDRVHQEMTNEAAQFENPKPAPPPPAREPQGPSPPPE